MLVRVALAVSLVLVVVLGSSPAAAQGNRPRVSIGLLGGFVVPSEDDAQTELSIGPLFRFGENEAGWGPAIGLGWYSSVLDGRMGSATGEYARIKVRPIMAGVSHTWHIDRWSYEAALTAGYTFNSVDLLDAGRAVFPGTTNVTVEISNAIAVRPRLRAWYEVNDRVAWMAGTGITFTRPELTFRSGTTTLTRELGGAAWQIETGIAVRVF